MSGLVLAILTSTANIVPNAEQASRSDLSKRPSRADYLSVPQDCADLLVSMRPLRAAAAAAGGTSETMTLIDRLIALCPGR